MYELLFATAGQTVSIAALCTVAAAAGTFFLIRFMDNLRKKDAETEAKSMIGKAKESADLILKTADVEAKEIRLAAQSEKDQEFQVLRDEIKERERSLLKREKVLDQTAENLANQEKINETTKHKLTEKIQETQTKRDELDKLVEMERQTLHDISGLSKQEATDHLMKILDKQMTQETGALILKHERKLKSECEDMSREILLTSLQRYAAAHTAETTTSTVDIPSDEMKGRIIGREGRNIRAFEKATGVDVIIDDTPGVVIVSAFDNFRREVARLALGKLIADGRIHPSRIEEIVESTRTQLERYIQKLGEQAAQDCDIHGLHNRIIQLLGRLHFRTSYSQNLLRHSVEVAFIAGMLAEELGYDEKLARRCGLLHDIGKAVDHEQEGGHPKIGADLLKRYGEPKEVIAAAAGHHDDIHVSNPYTVLVAAADAASASRPGARRDTPERYYKRMEELETIACEFPGVEHAFAIQAGRELRAMVSSKETSDEAAAKICHDIAHAFEQRLTYPGEIKVTVIRETRFMETAK